MTSTPKNLCPPPDFGSQLEAKRRASVRKTCRVYVLCMLRFQYHWGLPDCHEFPFSFIFSWFETKPLGIVSQLWIARGKTNLCRRCRRIKKAKTLPTSLQNHPRAEIMGPRGEGQEFQEKKVQSAAVGLKNVHSVSDNEAHVPGIKWSWHLKHGRDFRRSCQNKQYPAGRSFRDSIGQHR